MDYRPFGLLDMTPGFPAGGVTGRTPSGADDFGRLLYSMTGAGGAQDAAGLLGGPSVRENLRSGNNFDAGLQMLAALPVVGMLGTAGKVARGAQDAAKAEQTAAKLATRSVQPEGLLSPSVRPDLNLSTPMKPLQEEYKRLDFDAIRTKEDWREKMNELSSLLATIEPKASELSGLFSSGKITPDDIASMFDRYGVNFRSEASNSWSDRHGPSISRYFHFTDTAGTPKTFRFSDHDYAPRKFDYRQNTPIQQIENDLLNAMGINESNNMLDLYRQYMSLEKQLFPIKEDLWKLKNKSEESLPSVSSKRYQKKLAKER